MPKFFESFHSGLKQLWYDRLGGQDNLVPAFSNGAKIAFENKLRTDRVEALSVGPDNKLNVGGSQVRQGLYWPLIFRIGPNAEAVTACFHVFNQPSSIASGKPIGKVVAVEGIFGTQASAGTVTAQITKDSDKQAPGGGTSLTSDSFNLRSTNNTRQQLTLATAISTLEFTGGNRLSFKLTGTPTSFTNGLFVVWVQYYTAMAEVSFYRTGIDSNDQRFFIANRPYTLFGCSYMHKTAETTTTDLVAMLVKDTGTDAPGAGTDMLTNNTNTGFTCTSAANTVQTGTFATTAGLTTLAAGNRLSVDFGGSGSATECANCVLTVAFVPEVDRLEVSYFRRDTDALDECFFMANRDLEVYDARQLHGVAAGGASTAQLVKDASTDAPGAGTDLLQTTWNLNATANTIQGFAPLTTIALKDAILMVDGTRLAIDYADAEQSMLGAAVTVSLRAR